MKVYSKENIREHIRALGKWYQSMTLFGVETRPGKEIISGKPIWDTYIREMLPRDLTGLRILDIGCNAGYYSIMSAAMGAEVVAVEITDRWFNQAILATMCYSEMLGKDLNISYEKADVSDLDLEKSFGKFDYVYALAVLYHIGKHKYGQYTDKAELELHTLVRILSKIADRIIIRARDEANNNIEYYKKIFKIYGMGPVKILKGKGRRDNFALFVKV